MEIKEELVDLLILYIGDIENDRPFFKAEDVDIPGYDREDVRNHVAAMIEGNIIDGFFASDESTDHYGYLVGGLTIETRVLYNQMKKAQ